jgi:hypothetical protein
MLSRLSRLSELLLRYKISAISAVQDSRRFWSSGVMVGLLWGYLSIFPPDPVFAKVGCSLSVLRGSLLENYDYWLEDQVFNVWNILVGERMKGGKSTFTRSWVWNRLADGSDNHSPRTLLQLFVTAKEWEQREQSRNPYDKAIIRSRALTSSLETVSQVALDALIKEEFIELEPLVDQCKQIGRSPFNADELAGFESSVLSLALEVGLLAIHEGTEGDIQRYKVPDLYRLGIGMTRKGQA